MSKPQINSPCTTTDDESITTTTQKRKAAVSMSDDKSKKSNVEAVSLIKRYTSKANIIIVQ